MDNASIHKSEFTRNVMKTRGITWILNLQYNPILNPIERCFLALKTKFKQIRLSQLIRGKAKFNELDIKLALSQIKD